MYQRSLDNFIHSKLFISIIQIDHQVVEATSTILILILDKQVLELRHHRGEELSDGVNALELRENDQERDKGLLIIIVDISQNVFRYRHN